MTKEELYRAIGTTEEDLLERSETRNEYGETERETAEPRWEDAAIQRARGRARRMPSVWRIAIAACLVFVLGVGGAVYANDVREYRTAMAFFDENGLSTEGLSRADIKSVYRDITTARFTNEKTAEVILNTVPGLEIAQKEPTPDEIEAIWNRNIWAVPLPASAGGMTYRVEQTERMGDQGFTVLDKSIVTCIKDGEEVWTAEYPDLLVFSDGVVPTADGTAVYGQSYRWSSQQPVIAYLSRVGDDGTVLWTKRLDHGFEQETIYGVVDNGDGTWAVISRGDVRTLCLSQYDIDGKELSVRKTETGIYGIWNFTRFGDGYLAQLGNSSTGTTARIVKLDREGNILDDFSYEGDDCFYTITDMIEYGGRVYLSTHAVPKQTDEGGRHEIANVLDYVMERMEESRNENGSGYDVPNDELTRLVRDNYTAVLLLVEPEDGEPETFYAVKGSLGADLNVNDGGELVWDVQSVTSTFFSPMTSSFTIGGMCEVYRYAFDARGRLVREQDTGETVPYRR